MNDEFENQAQNDRYTVDSGVTKDNLVANDSTKIKKSNISIKIWGIFLSLTILFSIGSGILFNVIINNANGQIAQGPQGEKGDIGATGPQGEKGDIGATGPQGEKGADGDTPTIEISEDGYWILNGVKTNYKAVGTDGKDGVDGAKGDNGDTIKEITFDDQGRLVITLTDGTVLAPIEMPDNIQNGGSSTPDSGDNTPDSGDDTPDIPSHTHSFVEKDTDISYLATEANCTNSATYYYSCSCGDMNDQTFTDGEPNGRHSPALDGYCIFCSQPVNSTDGIIYDLSGDGSYAEVIGYNGTSPHVIIASTYEGKPVKSIYDEAFYDNDNITSVTIPDSITSIGMDAFYNCNSLTGVYITDLAAWCEISFDFYYDESYRSNPLYYAKNLYINNELVTDLFIPDGVTSISGYAFHGCSSLTSVTIPDSVTSIGNYAFQSCNSLTSVTIPDSVTSIGDCAFRGCSSLTSVTIGNGVTNIGYDAFYGCNSALYTEYEYGRYVGDEDNPYALLYELTNKNFSTYKIHEQTRIIGYGVFGGCERLATITIPNSVTSIGDCAFRGCSSLTSVTIPDSVTSIGDGAFEYCNILKYNEYDNAYYLGNSDNPYIVLVGAKTTSITSVMIHSNTKFIFSDAFSYCTSLTSVTIPDSVTSIGDCAFYECYNLTGVTIGNGVTSIGGWAFTNCYDLISVTIPDSVTIIGRYAFSNCESLTSVFYEGAADEWNEIAIDHYYNDFSDAALYYYSETKPTEEGNFWHYVDGVPTVWGEE